MTNERDRNGHWRLLMSRKRGQENCYGINTDGAGLYSFGEIIHHNREYEFFTGRTRNVSRETCCRTEGAGFGANIILCRCSLHSVSQSTVDARNWQRISKNICMSMTVHVSEQLERCLRGYHIVA